MSSPNNQKPKVSRTARISVKPVWRRKLDSCHNSSDVVPSQPTTKPQTHTNDSSHNPSSTLAFMNASSYDEHAQSKTTIPISLPILPMLLIQLKHHQLMKHIFHPYHVFMIIQAQPCLHHQEYHHHFLQIHMPFLCCMFKPSPNTTIMLHRHHLLPNT